MMIYLLIASEGEYSDKNTWIVQVFTDEAAAVEEAARLNAAAREHEVLDENYYARRTALRDSMAKAALAEESRSVRAEDMWFHLSRAKRDAIDARIDNEVGPYPEYPEYADDHMVVAVLVGERGKWELP